MVSLDTSVRHRHPIPAAATQGVAVLEASALIERLERSTVAERARAGGCQRRVWDGAEVGCLLGPEFIATRARARPALKLEPRVPYTKEEEH